MSETWLRTASERDLTAVAALLVENFNQQGEMDEDQRQAGLAAILESVEGMRKRLEKPQAEFLVADDGSEIGGMAFAAVDDGQTISLYRLAVGPARRRSGLGTSMLHEIEHCFPGAEAIRVEVQETDEAAIGFYSGNGFTTAARVVTAREGGAPAPALIMEKRL